MNQRVIASNILNQVIQQKRSLSSLLEENLSTLTNPQEKASIKDLCYGVLRWYYRLTFIADQLLLTPMKAKHTDIYCYLLIGLYQLIYRQSPDYAAVSETVSAVKKTGKTWAAGLINKCLRRYIEEQDEIVKKADKNPISHYAHPAWFIDFIKEAWPKEWQHILEANNEHPPLSLRVNQQATSQKEFISSLEKRGIDAVATKKPATAIRLIKPLPVNKIPGFLEGQCSVQDIAGQFVTPLLDLHPGQRVLDACAAPGSKTSHILETEPNIDRIIAIDSDASRLIKIKENINRLKLNHANIQLVLADICHTKQWWDGTHFDRILLDAPCSATGVIRRHPDIKILRQETDITKQAQQQELFLNALWPLLSPGGQLVYTTCSVLPQENEHIISKFIKTHPSAKPQPIKIPYGLALPIGRQLFPTPDGEDGFYYAVLKKEK